MDQSVVPFSVATGVTKLANGHYRANLVQEYCVGAVPNGGYVASVLVQAGTEHLASRGQPHTISAQFQYLNRTEVGEAIVVVEDVKKGRAVSTVHVTLYQGHLQQHEPFVTAKSRKLVVAYLINSDISREKGVTLSPGWKMLPTPAPVDLHRLASGTDPCWSEDASRIQISHLATLGFVRAVEKAFQSYYPRQPGPRGLEDAWIRLTSGERFTNAVLPLVADAKPYVVEGWRPRPGEEGAFSRDDAFWYPTLAMNLDIKKALPEKGVEWLFLRTEARKIHNGRLDLQVTILDEHGDLVAVASHVNLVLSAARNMAKREKL